MFRFTKSPVTTEKKSSARTFERGWGFRRDVRSELFLLAVTAMVGQQTVYESAGDRGDRYRKLVRAATIADPEWTARLLKWLRTSANMRSASLAGAAEFARARLDAGQSGMSRQVVDSVLQRADEPGQLLAYWTSRHGRAIPKPVKRGVADAVLRLYNERALLKYDTASQGFRFADVIDLVHPKAKHGWQGALFAHALDRRHDRDKPIEESLRVLNANAVLRRAIADSPAPETFVHADALRAAGMTWEDVLSLLGSKVDKARLWEALIPSMGYMALLRNLRNFDQAGVSDETAAKVAERLADPEQVARSRQFPFRFLSAYEATPAKRWGAALESALQASLANLPSLPGRSLVLVDTSGSMTGGAYSQRSTVTPAKAAAVFGVALAATSANVDVVGFATGVFRHEVRPGAAVLTEVGRFLSRIGEAGQGTDIARSLRRTYQEHDRVFILSDMQTIKGRVSAAVPANVPIYGFNLAGYQSAAYATGKSYRHEFGGLTDATFRMVPLLEAGMNGDWPF